MRDRPATSEAIDLAAIIGAHGVAGEVRLKLFGQGIEALEVYKHFNSGTLTLLKIRADKKGLAIARFAEISGRTDAEKHQGVRLSVSRDALPVLDDGEFYHSDLIGLKAISTSGRTLGVIIAVHNFGASDVVEIEKVPTPTNGMKTFMVPMNEQAVKTWDSLNILISEEFTE